MGRDCSKQVKEAIAGALKEHFTDMSEQIMGNNERQSGGIRLLDLHGGGAAAVTIGIGIGLFIGSAITAAICHRIYKPWKKMAADQERAFRNQPAAKVSRSAALARMAELRSAPAQRKSDRRALSFADDNSSGVGTQASDGTTRTGRTTSRLRGHIDVLRANNTALEGQLYSARERLTEARSPPRASLWSTPAGQPPACADARTPKTAPPARCFAQALQPSPPASVH